MKSTRYLIATAFVLALCLLGGTLAADLSLVSDQVTASADQTGKHLTSDQISNGDNGQENSQGNFEQCWSCKRR